MATQGNNYTPLDGTFFYKRPKFLIFLKSQWVSQFKGSQGQGLRRGASGGRPLASGCSHPPVPARAGPDGRCLLKRRAPLAMPDSGSSPAGMLDQKSLSGAVKLASQVALVVKNPPDDTEDVRDSGLIPRSQVRSLGRDGPLEEGMAAHSSILAWRIPWPVRLAGYSPWGHRESDVNAVTEQTCPPLRPTSPAPPPSPFPSKMAFNPEFLSHLRKFYLFFPWVSPIYVWERQVNKLLSALPLLICVLLRVSDRNSEGYRENYFPSSIVSGDEKGPLTHPPQVES